MTQFLRHQQPPHGGDKLGVSLNASAVGKLKLNEFLYRVYILDSRPQSPYSVAENVPASSALDLTLRAKDLVKVSVEGHPSHSNQLTVYLRLNWHFRRNYGKHVSVFQVAETVGRPADIIVFPQ